MFLRGLVHFLIAISYLSVYTINPRTTPVIVIRIR